MHISVQKIIFKIFVFNKDEVEAQSQPTDNIFLNEYSNEYLFEKRLKRYKNLQNVVCWLG
jgi:hypothetical protein